MDNIDGVKVQATKNTAGETVVVLDMSDVGKAHLNFTPDEAQQLADWLATAADE